MCPENILVTTVYCHQVVIDKKFGVFIHRTTKNLQQKSMVQKHIQVTYTVKTSGTVRVAQNSVSLIDRWNS